MCSCTGVAPHLMCVYVACLCLWFIRTNHGCFGRTDTTCFSLYVQLWQQRQCCLRTNKISTGGGEGVCHFAIFRMTWNRLKKQNKNKAECFRMHLSNIITRVSLDSVIFYCAPLCLLYMSYRLGCCAGGKEVGKMNENRLNPNILLMLSLALSIIAWILSIIQQPSFSDLFWETRPGDCMCDPWEPESLSLKRFPVF